MHPSVAVKRIGYGSKKGPHSRLVWAVVDHATQNFIEGKHGIIAYPYDKAGLKKAREVVADLKATK